MSPSNDAEWSKIDGVVTQGHRVASGTNGDARFPGGTISMQRPYFAAHGLALGWAHPATLNLSIAPRSFRTLRATRTIKHLRWHPTEPPETFSFFDCRIHTPENGVVQGFIYYPHPETKPEHHQPADVLEILAPFMRGIDYGNRLTIEVRRNQIQIDDA